MVESAGERDSDEELPEEPDWAALEGNVPPAGSSTESENVDCEQEDSTNFVSYLSGLCAFQNSTILTIC